MNIHIITPFPLQGSILTHAFKRHNVRATLSLPGQFSKSNFSPNALLFPHPMSQKEWEKHLKLDQQYNYIPIIVMNELNEHLFEKEQFKGLLPRIIQINKILDFDETAAIIKTTLLRKPEDENEDLSIGELRLDREQHRLICNETQSIMLTRKEFFLLELLMLNAGKTISRSRIIDQVWDRNTFVAQNTIDVYISRLRRKIDKHVNKTFITTVPCFGYQFEKKGTLQSSHI